MIRPRQVLRAVQLACVVLALVGCGGGMHESAGPVRPGVFGISIYPPSRDAPTFDASSVPLRQASERLARVAGHVVEVRVYATALPSSSSQREQVMVAAIDGIARDLEALRQVNPALFARAMPWLDRIELMPDPRGEATAFDTRGVLHLDGPLKRTPGAITRAFLTEYDEAREERYRAIDPTAVPPRERRAYFELLIRSRVNDGYLFMLAEHRALQQAAEAARVCRSTTAEQWLRVIALHEVTRSSDPNLAAEIRDWLADYAAHLSRFKVAIDVQSLAPDCPFRRAEAAFGVWLQANASSLPERQLLELASTVFPKAPVCSVCKSTRVGFPGFDSFAFGTSLVDRWIRAGHVGRVGQEHPGFFEDAAAHEGDRLAAFIAARRDAKLTALALGGAGEANRLRLWHALRISPTEHGNAAATIAGMDGLLGERRYEAALEAEAVEVYRNAPAHRGAALYILARSKHFATDEATFWLEFPRRVNEPIGAAELASFLDRGTVGFLASTGLWPALGKGWSRSAVLIPRIRRYFDDPLLGMEGPTKHLWKKLFVRFCEDKDPGEMAKLRAVYAELGRKGGETLATLAAAPCAP